MTQESTVNWVRKEEFTPKAGKVYMAIIPCENDENAAYTTEKVNSKIKERGYFIPFIGLFMGSDFRFGNGSDNLYFMKETLNSISHYAECDGLTDEHWRTLVKDMFSADPDHISDVDSVVLLAVPVPSKS
jgi:hypothetical protein